MTFSVKYPVVARYLTGPSKRRSMRPIAPAVRFLVAHDTGNPGSTAGNNVRYYEQVPRPVYRIPVRRVRQEHR